MATECAAVDAEMAKEDDGTKVPAEVLRPGTCGDKAALIEIEGSDPLGPAESADQ